MGPNHMGFQCSLRKEADIIQSLKEEIWRLIHIQLDTPAQQDWVFLWKRNVDKIQVFLRAAEDYQSGELFLSPFHTEEKLWILPSVCKLESVSHVISLCSPARSLLLQFVLLNISSYILALIY